MRVYRLENHEGGGPYSSGGRGHCERLWTHDSGGDAFGTHPGVHRDCPGFVAHTGMRSACVSLATLRRWFWGCREILEAAGFRVAAYDVPDEKISRGQYQLAFLPDDGKRAWWTSWALAREWEDS